MKAKSNLVYGGRLIVEDVLNSIAKLRNGSHGQGLLPRSDVIVRLERHKSRNARRILYMTLGAAIVLTGLILLQYRGLTAVEPFTFTDGISIWPAIIIRTVGLLLAVSFFVCVMSHLRQNIQELSRDFCLSPPCPPPRWKRCRAALWSAAKPGPDAWSRFAYDSLPWLWRMLSFCRNAYTFRWQVSISDWEVDRTLSANEVWRKYDKLGSWPARAARVIPVSFCFFIMGMAMFILNGIPRRPYRGWISGGADFVVLFLFIITYILVTFFVVDAIRLCHRFILNLSMMHTKWPRPALEKFRAERGGLDAPYLEEWIETQLIARRTQAIGALVYFPVILFVLSILARSEFFDHWPWPWALIVIMGLNAALAVYNIVALQHSARRARKIAMQQLQRKLWDLQARFPAEQGRHSDPKATAAKKRIEETLDEMGSLRIGAFAHFWQNPAIGALLLPSGGYAAVQILLRLLFQPELG